MSEIDEYPDDHYDDDGFLTPKGLRRYLAEMVGVERYRSDPEIASLIDGQVNIAQTLAKTERELEAEGVTPPRKRKFQMESLKQKEVDEARRMIGVDGD